MISASRGRFRTQLVLPGLCFVALLPCGTAAYAAGGAGIAPATGAGPQRFRTSGFGDLDERLAAVGPGGVLRVHSEEGTRLLSVRAESWSRPQGKSCEVYLRGIRSVPDGAIAPPVMAQLFLTMPVAYLKPLPPWEPISPEELETVRMLPEEKSALSRAQESSRKIIWEALILQRSRAYLESGTRDLYSPLSQPMDPWTVLEGAGFVPSLQRGTVPELLVRKFGPTSGALPMRQIIDRRHSIGERQAVMWSRSLYTDRSIDGFGEVVILDCPSEGSPLRIVHAVVADLERLKVDGLWARVTRWRVWQVARRTAEQYLESVADYIKRR